MEQYTNIYHHEPEAVAFCPYRISPLGAHIDHQFGKINGLAIDKGIHMAYSPKHNGVIELQSLNFEKRAQFHVASIEEKKVGDWADHLRGARFKGCCMALIDPDKQDEILAGVEARYLAAYPALKGKYTACVCHSSNGVKL